MTTNSCYVLEKPWNDARSIAGTAIAQYTQKLMQRLYLYAGNNQVCCCADDEPAPFGMELVSGDCLPRNMDVEQLTRWAYERLRRAPYLSIA